MKKDIKIPEAKGVCIAIVLEKHPEYETNDWYAYLINNTNKPIEMGIVVSKGFTKDKVTATFRHKVDLLPAKGYAKVEFIEKKLLSVNNQFSITYFQDNVLFEKTFLFKPHAIAPSHRVQLPVMNKTGILAE